MNIIADVAGQFDALMRLIKLMPDEDFLFVGDLIDRGPQSKEVVEWVMKNAKSLKGNHEDMMIDHVLNEGRYEHGVWFWNGGTQTQWSYNHGEDEMKAHATWMKKLPVYHQEDGLFVSHAAWDSSATLSEASEIMDEGSINPWSLLWNRGKPEPIDGKIQIMGHNSHIGLKFYGDKDNPYAVCINASSSSVLTGIHFPTLKVYQVPYKE